MPKSRIIRRSEVFSEAYEQGHCYVGRFMVLWLYKSDEASLRLGVVASKRVGEAVQRARAKRLLRELYRRYLYKININNNNINKYDIILVARRYILSADWEKIVNDFLSLLTKAKLIDK